MPKVYDAEQSLRQKLLHGINILADNVGSTLGPKGRNVILHAVGSNPVVTKDGVTVANFIDFEDPIENLGAQILKQASNETNNVAGDGTTTATVLARAILENAQKYLLAGVAPTEIKRGIDIAVKEVCRELERAALPITSKDDICHVATISANGDDSIGEMIAMAVDAIGKDGTITIEKGRSIETTLDIIEGFRFEGGYGAKAFITDERRNIVKHDRVLILVTDFEIEMVEELLPTLEIAARASQPLLVVAESLGGQALAAMIMNSVRGTMKVVGVKAPRYGEERRNILSDLAIACGATFFSRESGLSLHDIKLEHLGKAKFIESVKNFTTVVGGDGELEEIEKRIDSLKELIKQTDDLKECEFIQERITRLSSGVAVIRVGAPTEVEMVEKKHRIEDSLEAVRSAQEEGIVAGGGVALLRAGAVLHKLKTKSRAQNIGIQIILDSIEEPIKQMARNAGESPDIVVNSVQKSKGDRGFNFATSKLVNMTENGIIDPVKVTKTALLNAASVASTLLTTNHAVVEVP